MSVAENAPQSRRDWLLSDSPTTRRQARLGALYQGWLTFRTNKLAMFGLVILILLIGMAIFAAPELYVPI